MHFRNILRFNKKQSLGLGISLSQNSLTAVLLELKSTAKNTQSINDFKVICNTHCQFNQLKADGLNALILEDGKDGFEMLISAVKQLKNQLSLLKQSIQSNSILINAAVSLPSNLIFYKKLTFNSKEPTKKEISKSFETEASNIDFSQYLYDFYPLHNKDNQAKENSFSFQFYLAKKLLMEQIYSAFDLHQIQIQSIGVDSIHQLNTLAMLQNLSEMEVFALIKISNNQLNFLCNHPSLGFYQIDKPLWSESYEIVNELKKFIDEVFNSNPDLRLLSTLFLQIEFNSESTEQTNNYFQQLQEYFTEYFSDCELVEVSQIISSLSLKTIENHSNTSTVASISSQLVSFGAALSLGDILKINQ